MTQEEKELLLTDLYARLPYGVKIFDEEYGQDKLLTILSVVFYPIENIKPYLRPMSSMTFEERSFCLKRGTIGYDENDKIFDVYPYGLEKTMEVIDFLNAHHFDYRGLIKRGLALEAPEGMYNIK
jgi:hypothetical protein